MNDNTNRECPGRYPPRVLGYCDGLEAEPVWCAPITEANRERVSAMLEHLRADWRDRPPPPSGDYRINLVFDTETGLLDITLNPIHVTVPSEQENATS